MSGADLPEWLVRVAGAAPVLLVAPHGGRRPRASAAELEGTRKVNDLHTAELTLELAERLGAPAIINRAEDRNRLDLNRVRAVRAEAPWLLELLLEDARRQIAAVGEATFLFLHGWNAIQPSCDVGIGARLAAGAFVPVRQGRPTVPPRFVPRIARFAAACASGGVEVTIGDRYPAADADNLLQIFTDRFAADVDPNIRELARLGETGKIAAVQIELAVPLRWPGALRTHVMESITLLAEGSGTDHGVDVRPLDTPSAAVPAPDQLAVEFHDGEAGVGGFAATELLVSGRRHGRCLLAIGAKRLVLFTGEDAALRELPSGGMRCHDLSWTRAGDAIRLEYDGTCLTFPRTDPFLDLENGLAEADLSRLTLELEWRPLVPGAGLGRIAGDVRHDGWSTSIDAPAALQNGPTAAARPTRERTVVRVPLGDDTFLSLSAHRDTVEGEIIRAGRLEPLISGRLSLRMSPDGLTPEAWRIEAVSRSGPLRVFGQVTHAIPVVRATAEGKVLTFFGLARYTADERVGFGTFEESRPIGGKRKGSPS